MKIASTNSATPSLQAALSQSRLEQARRRADQAQNIAKDLRTQADQAEVEAQSQQNTVQGLNFEAAQTNRSTNASRNANFASASQAVYLNPVYSASGFAASSGVAALRQNSTASTYAFGQRPSHILDLEV